MSDDLRGLRITASIALMNKILKSPKTRKSLSPKLVRLVLPFGHVP